MSEDVLLRTQPKMLKGNPGLFILSILLIPVFGIGLIILLFWWLSTYSRELVITKNRARRRSGILSNQTSELEHRDIKNVQVEQGIIQNLTGCGTVRLSSAGQSGMEIEVNSIEDPEGIRDLIYQQRDRD